MSKRLIIVDTTQIGKVRSSKVRTSSLNCVYFSLLFISRSELILATECLLSTFIVLFYGRNNGSSLTDELILDPEVLSLSTLPYNIRKSHDYLLFSKLCLLFVTSP